LDRDERAHRGGRREDGQSEAAPEDLVAALTGRHPRSERQPAGGDRRRKPRDQPGDPPAAHVEPIVSPLRGGVDHVGRSAR